MNDALDNLIYSDPSAGLLRLRELAHIYGNDKAFQSNFGSRLIDIGRDLKDIKLIGEGISETTKILGLVPTELRSGLEINIALPIKGYTILLGRNSPSLLKSIPITF